MITEYKEESYNADKDGCWPSSACRPLEPGIMKVLYVHGIPYMCNYLCPCGCGAPCPTFFPIGNKQRTPERRLWDFSKGSNGPTLSPSIKHNAGCKSHYNITDGKVIMHSDSGK